MRYEKKSLHYIALIIIISFIFSNYNSILFCDKQHVINKNEVEKEFSISSTEQNLCQKANTPFYGKSKKSEGILIPTPINLTQCNLYQTAYFAVHDLDKNSFPEVIFSEKNGEYTNISTIQMNETGKWKKNDLGSVNGWFSGLYDVNSDNQMEIVLRSWSFSSNFSILRVKNNSLENNVTYLEFPEWINSKLDIIDIDCDGDFDLIGATIKNNSLFAINDGMDAFHVGWDNGIPRERGGLSSHNYYITNDIKMCDINNDGWPDYCTAMGDGKDSLNAGFCQYYNWLSDGKGSWNSFSSDFPRNEDGERLDLADIDNDGDLDCGLVNEVTNDWLNWKNKVYIYENINGESWMKKSIPKELSDIDDLYFIDINDDGNIDILTIRNIELEDTNGDPYFKNIINISYGFGNFSWSSYKQFEMIGEKISDPIFEDMDRDGDKDVIFRIGNNILYCENNLDKRKNLTFVDKPISPHLRSGSLHSLSWTMIDSAEKIKDEISFHFTVSYTGINGPYFPIKIVNNSFWTEFIVPNIPSNDVYFRINYSEYEATTGPYTIHNTEGMQSMIELKDPEYGTNLVEDEEVNLTFRTSRFFPEGDNTLYLKWGNDNRTSLGTYSFQSGSNTTIQVRVPSGIFSMASGFQVGIPWYGHQRSVDAVSKVNIIPREMIPSRFVHDEYDLMKGYTKTVNIPVLSLEDTNITDDCDYDVIWWDNDLKVRLLKNGSMNLTCEGMGEHHFLLSTTRFSRTITTNITVRSHPPIDSIYLQTEEDDPRVGQEMEIFLRGKDPGGYLTYISSEFVQWSVTGDCSYTTSGGGVTLIPHSVNNIDINVIVDAGLGPITESMTIKPGPMLLDVTIRSDSNGIMNGTTTSFRGLIGTYNFKKIEGYTILWDTGPNGMVISTVGDKAEILATDQGPLSVSVEIQYFNESVSDQISIDVTPSPYNVIPERELVQEAGTTANYDLNVVTDSGDPFQGEYFISHSLKDLSMASVSIEDDVLTMIGEKEGTTFLTLNLSTDEGISFERTFPVTITSTPVEIIFDDHPSFLRVDDSMYLNFSVLDHRDEEVTGYSVEVNSDLTDVELLEEGYLRIDGKGLGKETITISVEKYDTSIVNDMKLDIIQVANSIEFDYDPEPLPVGEDLVVQISLIDINGELIEWNDFEILHHKDLSIINTNGTLTINTSRRGTYGIEVRVDHYGIFISNSMNFTFYEPSVLSELVLLNPEKNVFEIVCLDQFGENITDRCEIIWEGEFELISPYKAELKTEKNTVSATYNGTTLERNIIADINNDDSGFPVLIPILIIAMLAMIGSIGALIYIKKIRPRAEDESADDPEMENEVP